MNRLQLLKESVVAAGVLLCFTILLLKIPLSNEFRKGLFQGFGDFDVYDLHYWGKNKEPQKMDTNIVLVSIGNSRSKIAEQINILSQCHPKVIGIDALFEEERNPLEDQLLFEALDKKDNIVLAARFSNIKQATIVPNHFDPTGSASGFANFIGNKYSVNRTYPPFLTIGGERINSFSSAILQKSNPTQFNQLVKRNNGQELIHYKGNLNNYISLTEEELEYYHETQQLESVVGGKIVLLGFFVKQEAGSASPLVLEDLHFSPLNEIIFGKSFPDMYGVVMHANILSMVIHNDYATLATPVTAYLFSFILTSLFLFYVLRQHLKKHHPSHGKLMFLQFTGILLFIYLFILLFDRFQFKVPLQPIIIPFVLSLELLGVYKLLALWLHKRFRYQTIFTLNHTK